MSDAAAMPRRTEYRANTSAPAYLGPSCELDREDWCPPPPMVFLDATTKEETFPIVTTCRLRP